MTTAEEIAEAVWTNGTRTLASGTPSAPANQAEEIAEAVWQNVTRTLTGGAVGTGIVFNLQIG